MHDPLCGCTVYCTIVHICSQLCEGYTFPQQKKIVTAIAKKEVIGITSDIYSWSRPKLKSEIQLLQQKQQQQNPYSCLYSLPSRDFIIEVENQREIQKV